MSDKEGCNVSNVSKIPVFKMHGRMVVEGGVKHDPYVPQERWARVEQAFEKQPRCFTEVRVKK